MTVTTVPFDTKGNLMEYPMRQFLGRDNGGQPVYQEPVWVANDPFEMRLILTGYERGRSAARFLWKDMHSDRKFPMFMTDMVDFLKHGDVVRGETAAHWWIVKKRGQNYGIALKD